MTVGPVDLYTSAPSEAGVPTSAPKRNASRYLVCGVLVIVIALFAAVRFRLRDTPLERDEGEFAYGGQLILQGLPLYDNLYTLKMPGTYAAYAGIMAVLGQTRTSVHIGLIFVNAAATLLVFFLTARMFGRLAALVAAASYAALSTSLSVMGFAGHATHFVVLCTLAALYLLLAAIDGDKRWLLFCSGLLLGLAFLMKQPGVFFIMFAGLYLVWRRLRASSDWKKPAYEMAVLCLGSVLPFLLTCLATWSSGSFDKFWFWTFSYASRYGTNVGLLYGLKNLKGTGHSVVSPAIAIWAIAGLGLIVVLWNRRVRSNRFFLIAFLLLSFLAVSAGLLYREHYFILMLPAIAILAGVAISCATEMLRDRTRSRLVLALPVLIFLGAFSSTLYRQRDYLFQMGPQEAARRVYGDNPFPEAIEIARYIASTTPPNSTAAIFGCEPEIYFYAHLHAATGHVCPYDLLEPKYGPTLQKEMEEEIQSSRPDILVLVVVPSSWVALRNVIPVNQILDWAKAYIRQYYTVVGIVEMDKHPTEYFWGERARSHPMPLARTVVVLKRTRF